jgi:hypothetical protein
MAINKSTAHVRDFNKATRESFETHDASQSESCECDRCRLNLPWPARCVRVEEAPR